MEYRHLRFFLALADELHFTRAAERLGVAQPHLSHEIRRLERELGVELLTRTRRRVELTPAGLAFRERAHAVLAATDDAVEAARRAARGEIGRLAIGFAGSVGYDVFPDAIRRFRSRWPEVELSLREMTTAGMIDRLRDGAIDVGVGRPRRAVEAGLHVEIVRREAPLIALASTHPLAGRPKLRLRDFADEPWIVTGRSTGSGLFTWLLEAADEAGFTPRIAQEAGQVPTLVNLVATGLGVALVPESVRRLARDGVVYRSLHGRVPPVHLALLYARDQPPPLVAHFLEAVREAAAEPPES